VKLILDEKEYHYALADFLYDNKETLSNIEEIEVASEDFLGLANGIKQIVEENIV